MNEIKLSDLHMNRIINYLSLHFNKNGFDSVDLELLTALGYRLVERNGVVYLDMDTLFI